MVLRAGGGGAGGGGGGERAGVDASGCGGVSGNAAGAGGWRCA